MDDVTAIAWRDDALELLDQRRLPSEEVWLRCETHGEVAEAIRSLAVRGAPAIGIAAAYGLALAALRGEDVDAACEELAATRPTAVDLRWALERVRAAGAPEAVLEEAHRISRERVEADERIGELGAALFSEGDRVLTHCNTGPLATGGRGTAAGGLRAAWERGRLGQVWVDETRPLLQGARLTAWELDRQGIPYRLVADAGAGFLMARGLVSGVIVGADRIARNGDVANKVGTYPLAVLAERHGIPFYVAAPVSTIDPDTPSGEAIVIEERDPEEVVEVAGHRIAPEGAQAANPAFDVTPADLVTAIVTEAGVLEPPYEEAIARVLGR
jgi:methylthioribose-1-phosphate isomerase